MPLYNILKVRKVFQKGKGKKYYCKRKQQRVLNFFCFCIYAKKKTLGFPNNNVLYNNTVTEIVSGITKERQ